MNNSVLFAALSLVLLVSPVVAHEVYVLDAHTISSGFNTHGINVFHALQDQRSSSMFWTGLLVTLIIFILLSYLFHTKLSKRMDARFSTLRKYAHLVIRIGLGISFAWGALHNSIFGPELPLSMLPGGMLLWKPLLFAVGLMLIFGALTRLAATISLVAFLLVTIDQGWYMMNYLNYFGEILILMLERGELFSVDRLIKWRSDIFHRRLPEWFGRLEALSEKYSFPILRITFGIALIWAAMTVKILYPALSLDVLHNFGLDLNENLPALLIVLVAGLFEIWLGLALITGILYRMHLAIIVVFVGYSVWFFGEEVWPHAILVGLGIGLFLHGKDRWMIDDKVYRWCWGWTKRFRKSKNALSPE